MFTPGRIRLFLGVAVLPALLFFTSLWFWETPVDYSTEVKPILNKHCLACHGGVKKAAGFSLLFRYEALDTTESGVPAIVPGNAKASEMIRRLTHADPEVRMPPQSPPLSEAEIALLTRWVDQGAKWGNHWAYVPVAATPKPVAEALAGIFPSFSPAEKQHPIDALVSQRLKGEGLALSPVADPHTLVRRLTLDLTGLPPTPEQVKRFTGEKPEPYGQLVDELLASPSFGERWASFWLDLARYADSKGYERDGHRNSWRYRDWVINAFNQDMPFNQFTIEQLAGDLLENPTDGQLLATGFHRNTMNNDEGGTDDEEFRVAAVIDRVNTTFEVWQGTSFSCVQCHSHPYDPFKHEEYYQVMAFFNNDCDEDTPGEYPVLKMLHKQEELDELERLKAWGRQLGKPPVNGKTTERQIADLIRLGEPKMHPKLFTNIHKGSLADSKFLVVDHQGNATLPAVTLKGQRKMVISYATPIPGTVIEIRRGHPQGEVLTTLKLGTTERFWHFKTAFFDFPPLYETLDLCFVFHNPATNRETSMIEWVLLPEMLSDPDLASDPIWLEGMANMMNRPLERVPVMQHRTPEFSRTTRTFIRGNWLEHGEKVTPGVPGSLNPFPAHFPQNRLGLAQWLVQTENPLTARVMVNRIWEQLFGQGLVETVEDFGTQGALPTHPQLLDYLAWQFMHTHQWSIKSLIREIVTSQTYRQRSYASPELMAQDPYNRLLARGSRYRLSGEQIRDQALAVACLLQENMHGPSTMPFQPEGIWQVVYSGITWQTKPEEAFRKGVYTYTRRTTPYPSLITFDAPSREFCVNRRIRTNTPLQAMVTLNDTVYVMAARGLANQMLLTKAPGAEEKIAHGYALCMGKPIPPAKLAPLVQLYQTAKTHYAQDTNALAQLLGVPASTAAMAEKGALTIVANALLNLDEFLTRE